MKRRFPEGPMPMTQDASPVGGEATPVDARTDALNAFEEIAAETFPDEEEEQPAEGDEPEGEPTEEAEDEPEAEAEADDDLPPIEPPVSLTAEEKEAFKNLPREAQEFTARRIGELEKGFNAKAQEAARARQEAEHAAVEQLTAIQRSMAQELQQYAQQFEVPKPSLELLAIDQAQYFAQMERYEQANAQRQQAQQQAQQYAQQAEQYERHLEQQRLQQERALIVDQFPDYADPTKHETLRAELTGIARDMGYPPELIEQARAADILAMRKAAEWKAKADQLDKLNKGKMERVRAARNLPPVARPGTAVSSNQTRQANADAAFDRAKSARTINERADAFGEWASAAGLI